MTQRKRARLNLTLSGVSLEMLKQLASLSGKSQSVVIDRFLAYQCPVCGADGVGVCAICLVTAPWLAPVPE